MQTLIYVRNMNKSLIKLRIFFFKKLSNQNKYSLPFWKISNINFSLIIFHSSYLFFLSVKKEWKQLLVLSFFLHSNSVHSFLKNIVHTQFCPPNNSLYIIFLNEKGILNTWRYLAKHYIYVTSWNSFDGCLSLSLFISRPQDKSTNNCKV